MRYLLPPFLCWSLILGIFLEIRALKNINISIRETLLASCITWGSLLVFITEGLSLFKLISRPPLFITWGCIALLLFLVFLGLAVRHRYYSLLKGNAIWQATVKFFRSIPSNNLFWIAAVLILFQVITLWLVARLYPPNNYDSMTYHLARVMHWMQNQSVADYASSIVRQLQLQPFAEFVILQLLVLTNTDLYANLVQWASMVICLIGVSNISARLGANPLQQIGAALLTAYIPMGLLQATSTQNDYVVTACLVCFVSLGLRLIEQPRSFLLWFGTGLSLGLALLTKGTAYVFSLPFCIYIGIKLVKNLGIKAIPIGLTIASLALVLNLGYFVRNFSLFGSAFGPDADFYNQGLSLRFLGSNIIRNTALHFFPFNGDPAYITAIEKQFLGWMRLVYGLTGISPMDPRNSWSFPVADPFNLASAYMEDLSGNPLHAILVIITSVLVIRALLSPRRRQVVWYGILVITAFLLYCLLLKWQIWGSRLQLPLFVLWSPACILFLNKPGKRFSGVLPILIAVLCVKWIFLNETRPVDLNASYKNRPRIENVFNFQPRRLSMYQDTVTTVQNAGCNQIGLILGEDTWEYPFWLMLKPAKNKGRIEHIQVQNQSARLEDVNFKPCAIISIKPIKQNQDLQEAHVHGFYVYTKASNR